MQLRQPLAFEDCECPYSSGHAISGHCGGQQFSTHWNSGRVLGDDRCGTAAAPPLAFFLRSVPPCNYNRWASPQLVGLTSLFTRNPPVLPKLNRRRAMFVLTNVDEIPAWEKLKEAERDTRLVELGRYLCEVRTGQYWQMQNVKSLDEFLARRFPESRRKTY
jgi:hypothetical protein